jgi:hypothetical protein
MRVHRHQETLTRLLQDWPVDQPFTVADFPQWKPAHVRRLLRPWLRSGQIWSCSPGMWFFWQPSRFFADPRPPGAQAVLEALTRRTGEVLSDIPLAALNRLHFSTQMVVREIHATTGPSRVLRLYRGPGRVSLHGIALRHAPAWRMPAGDPLVRLALGALSDFGPQAIGPQVLAHLQFTLPSASWEALLRLLPHLPDWLGQALAAYQVAPPETIGPWPGYGDTDGP